MFSIDDGEVLRIWDFRPIARQPQRVLRGVDRLLYRECDAIADPRRLAAVARAAGHTLTPSETEARLAPLVEQGLVLREGVRHLALALPVGAYAPPPWAMERLRRAGRRTRRDRSSGIAP